MRSARLDLDADRAAARAGAAAGAVGLRRERGRSRRVALRPEARGVEAVGRRPTELALVRFDADLMHTRARWAAVAQQVVAVRLRQDTLADGREATVTEVDSRFLPMMGVSLAAGRHFSADEAQPGAGVPVAMVSATMWDRLFGVALPSSGGIDASLTLADRTYRVVGVLAPGF